MHLHEIFTSGHIKLHLEALDKDEVFEEMTDFLIKVSEINCRDEILNALRSREQKMSTGIKNGIAIPHGKLDNFDGIIGVLGISDKGIDYDALDKKPVHLVFLFVSSYSKHQEHLNLLSNIAKLSENNQILNMILNAKTKENVNELL
ncbi:MAG: hypothetical protein ACD_79C00995G0004 [uncultured bacterium]|nr:MAG: hypothetical protein ACD_79C00995G0004 [uncultured bacterium]